MHLFLAHLTNRTAEMLVILNLFHLLLVGLILAILFHQRRADREAAGRPDRLLTMGFGLLAIHLTILTLHFGAAFFLHLVVNLESLERVSHGLFVAGMLLVLAAVLDTGRTRRSARVLMGLPILAALILLDMFTSSPALSLAGRPHSVAMVLSDLLGLMAVAVSIEGLARRQCIWEGQRMSWVALGALAAVFPLDALPSFLPRSTAYWVWNIEEHSLTLALLAFAWVVGEQSRKLLDRVYMRLNLTFVVLAGLILIITAGMARYQYFHLAEERSRDLAEFLRAQVVQCRARGEGLDQILADAGIRRRVASEFGTLPELRKVNLYMDGYRATFKGALDRPLQIFIQPQSHHAGAESEGEISNRFQMIRLPLGDGAPENDGVEFVGTMSYMNRYIGRYIILVCLAFLATVELTRLITRMITAEADRQLRRQDSKLEEAQRQLAQSAKLASLGELAGGVAHEINNPLTSILALSSHLTQDERSAALSPRSRKNLQLIARQAERAADIARGLLSFSRQERPQRSTLDIAKLLETAMEHVQYRLKDVPITVRQEIEPNLPRVEGDASRLTGAFVNLLGNAIDAMPYGGTLTLRAWRNREDNTVHVEIQDSGEGISAEHLPRIFDAFFTTKPPGRGTGLGLYISHGIIKDHGGEIWARSEPGTGTTVALSLLARGRENETQSARH